jgi:hypothetical protein
MQLLALLFMMHVSNSHSHSKFDYVTNCAGIKYQEKYEIAKLFGRKSGQGAGFVMFEHLHKSGGSTLCGLMQANSNVKFRANINCNLIDKIGKIWRSVPHGWGIDRVEKYLNDTQRNVISNEDAVFPAALRPALFSHRSSFSPWSFITILRNPVDRILSHYRFENLNLTYHSVMNWVVESPFHTQNFMVRKFASMYPPKLTEEKKQNPSTLWGNILDRSNMRYDINSVSTVPPVTEQDLALAKETLSQFSVVLILEWLSETAPLLGYYFNTPVDDTLKRNWEGKIEKHNPNGTWHPKRKISRKLYEKIADYNKHDIELYKYAKLLAKCNVYNLYFSDD